MAFENYMKSYLRQPYGDDKEFYLKGVVNSLNMYMEELEILYETPLQLVNGTTTTPRNTSYNYTYY